VSNLAVAPARPEDVPALVSMVHELAEYERAPEQCHLTDEQLRSALCTENPALYGHVATLDGVPIGYALWFLNFSTGKACTASIWRTSTSGRRPAAPVPPGRTAAAPAGRAPRNVR
jgi:hypothetical protein